MEPKKDTFPSASALAIAMLSGYACGFLLDPKAWPPTTVFSTLTFMALLYGAARITIGYAVRESLAHAAAMAMCWDLGYGFFVFCDRVLMAR